MANHRTRCVAGFVITLIIFVVTSVITLVVIEEEMKPVSDDKTNYHRAQHGCQQKNSTLITTFNATQFYQLINYCKYKLKSSCWVGLYRTGCVFDDISLKYSHHGNWTWADMKLYNKTYYERNEDKFWCDGVSTVNGITHNNAKYPKLGPHWEWVGADIDITRRTDISFCELSYVYIDIKSECLKNGFDGYNPVWGNDNPVFWKKSVCANDNYREINVETNNSIKPLTRKAVQYGCYITIGICCLILVLVIYNFIHHRYIIQKSDIDSNEGLVELSVSNLDLTMTSLQTHFESNEQDMNYIV